MPPLGNLCPIYQTIHTAIILVDVVLEMFAFWNLSTLQFIAAAPICHQFPDSFIFFTLLQWFYMLAILMFHNFCVLLRKAFYLLTLSAELIHDISPRQLLKHRMLFICFYIIHTSILNKLICLKFSVALKRLRKYSLIFSN